jgi:hypothetical protein
MDKYVCTLCGYVYDPEAGDPDNGVTPVPNGKMSPRTGNARSAAQVKTISKKRIIPILFRTHSLFFQQPAPNALFLITGKGPRF